MSVPLPETDLSTAVIGQLIPVDITKSMQVIPLSQVQSGKSPHITLNNRSGFGLKITLPQSAKTFNLPPNSHTNMIPISAGETTISVFVNYGAPYGPINGNKLFGDLYLPIETESVVQSVAVDSLSEPRVINIPIVPISTVPQNGFFHFPADNSSHYLLGPRAFNASNAGATNHFLNFYLYSLSVQIRNPGWAIFSITAQTLTVGGAVVNGVNLFGGIVDGGGLQGPQIIKYESPYPLLTQLAQIGGDPNYGLALVIFQSQNPGTNDYWLNATIGVDEVNGGVPGAIGAYAQPPSFTVPVNPATF